MTEGKKVESKIYASSVQVYTPYFEFYILLL